MNDEQWLESDPEIAASLERAESDVKAGQLKPWDKVNMKKRAPADMPYSAIFGKDGDAEITMTIPKEMFSKLSKYAAERNLTFAHAISAIIRLHLCIEDYDPELAKDVERALHLQEFDGLLKRVSKRFKEFDESGGKSEPEIMAKIEREKNELG